MNIITSITSKGRTFHLVFYNGYYCAIEDKLLDSEGRLTTELNGLQMMASKTLEGCLSLTLSQIEVDKLVNEGVDPMQAAYEVVCRRTRGELQF